MKWYSDFTDVFLSLIGPAQLGGNSHNYYIGVHTLYLIY